MQACLPDQAGVSLVLPMSINNRVIFKVQNDIDELEYEL